VAFTFVLILSESVDRLGGRLRVVWLVSGV
jgi:hypothetical protein